MCWCFRFVYWVNPNTRLSLSFSIKNCIITTKVYDTQSIDRNFNTRTTAMSTTAPLSLHTLPVELVYRILDNLDQLTIFLSMGGVCARLNAIIDNYHPYGVITYWLQNNIDMTQLPLEFIGYRFYDVLENKICEIIYTFCIDIYRISKSCR